MWTLYQDQYNLLHSALYQHSTLCIYSIRIRIRIGGFLDTDSALFGVSLRQSRNHTDVCVRAETMLLSNENRSPRPLLFLMPSGGPTLLVFRVPSCASVMREWSHFSFSVAVFVHMMSFLVKGFIDSLSSSMWKGSLLAGSGDGLVPFRHQAITRTNTNGLQIDPIENKLQWHSSN